jgi:23S rRNA pseudouridine955/2504/2580 synthase
VHGGSGISQGVIEILRSLRPPPAYLELAHRLDRETSGCLLIAKKRSALRQLQKLQQEKCINKNYLAMVKGSWPEQKMRVDAPLRKNTLQSGERIVTVDPTGKVAKTSFRVEKQLGDYQLIKAQLGTGRTHQIRVHAAHLGTPIVGDEKYGNAATNKALRQQGLKRLFLHAWQLRFSWPNQAGQHHFIAPLPDELTQVINTMAKQSNTNPVKP